jgi:hypothetical protein
MPQPRLRCLLVLSRRRQRSAQFRFRRPIYQSISTVQPRLPPPSPTHRASQSCPPSVRIASNPPRRCTLATQIPIGGPTPPPVLLLPAVSSLGGFRMPAARCRGTVVSGRHPKTFTIPVVRNGPTIQGSACIERMCTSLSGKSGPGVGKGGSHAPPPPKRQTGMPRRSTSNIPSQIEQASDDIGEPRRKSPARSTAHLPLPNCVVRPADDQSAS